MKKVRIFRAWFSHGSGAVLALKTFGIIIEETFFIVEICFVTFEKLLGRTLLRVLVFGMLFSPHFGVHRQSLFSKETMLKPCLG